MGKYKQVLINSFSQYIAYRLNFFLWRVRTVISILITYYLWLSVYQQNTLLFGYEKQQMITYVLFISTISAIVLSSQTQRVAQDINDGNLSKYLLHPINYIWFVFTQDVADKCINTVCSVVELIFLFVLLRPQLYIQQNILTWIQVGISIFFATLIYFFINMLLSFIGFWSRESWAPKFIFSILIVFLAGLYFPIDIYPAVMVFIMRILPFSYLIYFPMKIYLGQIPFWQVIIGYGIECMWCLILYYWVKQVWKKGLRLYTAEGI
jgi:ABC-2 type transport system permease protein